MELFDFPGFEISIRNKNGETLGATNLVIGNYIHTIGGRNEYSYTREGCSEIDTYRRSTIPICRI
jgi:hypothetical protein